MTNYERLLDLSLREVLKEFGNPNIVEAAQGFSFFMNCCDPVGACSICGDVERGSCAVVCEAWLDSESAPDANYNEDRCFYFKKNPLYSDKIKDYLVIIDGLDFWNIEQLHGDKFLDIDGNVLNVTHYHPMPKLPEEVMKNAD